MRKKKKILLILAFFIIVLGVAHWIFTKNDFSVKPEDIVNTHKPETMGRFSTFISNIENGKPDTIRLKDYGKEGQPTVIDMRFDGKYINADIDETIGYMFPKERIREKGQYTKIQKIGTTYYLVDETGLKNHYLFEEH